MSAIRLLLLSVVLFWVFSCQDNGSQNSSRQEQPENPTTDSEDVLTEHNNGFQNELDDPERDQWQKPELVIRKFGKLDGKLIADIGAGTGYFSFRLAAQGADVLAIDIDSNFLDHIEELARDIQPRLKGEIDTRLSPPDSPSLAVEEADGVLIVNTVSYFPKRESYLKEIYQGLKSGGKLIIVDFKAGATPVRPPENLLISSDRLVTDLKKAGFRNIEIETAELPYQYIIIAVKP